MWIYDTGLPFKKKKVDKSAHGQSKISQKQYIQEILKN